MRAESCVPTGAGGGVGAGAGGVGGVGGVGGGVGLGVGGAAPAGSNIARTECAVVIERTQVVAVPEQSPDQPENDEPAAAAAVSVTCRLTVPAHSEPQLIDPSALVTVPLPEPPTDTPSANRCRAKVTPMAFTAPPFRISLPVTPSTTHEFGVGVDAQPVQPERVEYWSGTPVSSTARCSSMSPRTADRVQEVVHESPAGALVTTPAPSPAIFRSSSKGLVGKPQQKPNSIDPSPMTVKEQRKGPPKLGWLQTA